MHEGHNIIILSDRMASPDQIPIPSLLATSAVHHHLIRKGLRTSVGLVIETGEAREVHQFATLAGFGAEAINPYLAFETIEDMLPKLAEEVSREEAAKRYIKAIDKGLLKVMSKMGISTYQSYCGAQIFDAVGLKQDFIDSFFTGTSTQVEGVGLAEIATETVARHRMAFPMRRSIATPSMSAATMRSASGVNHTSGNLKSWPICNTPCVATFPKSTGHLPGRSMIRRHN